MTRALGARRTLALAILAAAAAACQHRSISESPQATLDAAIAAHGGSAALAHLANLKVVSRLKFKGQLDLVRTIHFRAPHTWSMKLDALGGTVMAFGVDGERCWRRRRQWISPCSDGDTKEDGRITDVLNARLLLNVDRASVATADPVDVSGRLSPALRAGALTLAFDPSSHRLAQIRYDEGWVETFADFQDVGGALVAAHRTLTIQGEPDVDEHWDEILPGGAELERLTPPPLSAEGITIDEIDAVRPVAWTEITDLDAGVSPAITALQRFTRSKGRSPSESDEIVFTLVGEAPPKWQLAIGVEAAGPQEPVQEGAMHLEDWPARRVVGIFHRGDPRAMGDQRAAVEKRIAEASTARLPGASWQALCLPEDAARPVSERLWLLRTAVRENVP